MGKDVKERSTKIVAGDEIQQILLQINTELVDKLDQYIDEINLKNIVTHSNDQKKLVNKLTAKNISAEQIQQELRSQTPRPLKVKRRHVIEQFIKTLNGEFKVEARYSNIA